MTILMTPAKVGRYTLRNRLVMSPMTRSRCDDATGIPTDLVPVYYGQRASAGLIITEGTGPSPMSKGYVRTPGIHSAGQVAGWRKVCDAVHAKGGLIFLQIMHCGRIAHPDMLPGHAQPLAPSAVKAAGQSFTNAGMRDHAEPRALLAEEVRAIVQEHANATALALEAGFDGVELHAASGYLAEQFLSSKTNLRTDEYGGSIEKRARFILEALAAMIAVAGADRVGMKIAPEMGFNDIADATPKETYRHLVERIAPLGMAYLHVQLFGAKFDYHGALRPLFKGAYLHGSGLTQQTAEKLIASREADATVFGSLYLANPDLIERFAKGAALNVPDKDTFYTPGPKGYIDYPAMATETVPVT
jgi:N-ethylmaleimide reductase